MTARAPASSRRIVVLARVNDATAITVHYLEQRFDDVVTVVEQSGSRAALARRRAKRLGWVEVAGQLAFTTLALPVLARRGEARVRAIMAEAGVDATPLAAVRHVESVNSPECIALLKDLAPAVVVVQGTRIISPGVLVAVGCPFVNTHAGITPRYRGMHGGYWALTEGRPDLVGTTVHLVDPGIDTGTVLARTYFAPGPDDSIATYPYLHLVAGLPALAEQVAHLVAAGGPDAPAPTESPASPATAGTPAETSSPNDSRLWSQPTLWGYLARRWRTGVR
jgi:folate-dependent phosphoribosylglycinamide formyltransferase PurN